MYAMMSAGEEKAWEILQTLEPSTVCKNASVAFDESHDCYIVRSFCFDFQVKPGEKTMKCLNPSGENILKRYGYFFIHSCLWYLVHAKDIPFTKRLIKPVNLKGGERFFRGSHVLPLDDMAQRYGDDKTAFLNKGEELRAKISGYDDASLTLLPFPKIPVILILWLKDEEFPPRADLLLDSSCEMQLPLDIIWSIAMVSVLVMM